VSVLPLPEISVPRLVLEPVSEREKLDARPEADDRRMSVELNLDRRRGFAAREIAAGRVYESWELHEIARR
jgi:hypothetical protein